MAKKTTNFMPITSTTAKRVIVESGELADGRVIRFIISTDINGQPIIDIHVPNGAHTSVDFLGTIYCPTKDSETGIKVKLNKRYFGCAMEY